MDWRGLILVAVLGICIGRVSGFVENPPEASIIGHKYYGYPLVWRIVRMFFGEEYLYLELFFDCLIWIAIILVIAMFAWESSRWRSRKNARISQNKLAELHIYRARQRYCSITNF